MFSRCHCRISLWVVGLTLHVFPGAIANESSLLTYDSDYLLDTYFHAPRHDPSFIPAFSTPDNEHDPLMEQASKICSGDGDAYCRYDITVHQPLGLSFTLSVRNDVTERYCSGSDSNHDISVQI